MTLLIPQLALPNERSHFCHLNWNVNEHLGNRLSKLAKLLLKLDSFAENCGIREKFFARGESAMKISPTLRVDHAAFFFSNVLRNSTWLIHFSIRQPDLVEGVKLLQNYGSILSIWKSSEYEYCILWNISYFVD